MTDSTAWHDAIIAWSRLAPGECAYEPLVSGCLGGYRIALSRASDHGGYTATTHLVPIGEVDRLEHHVFIRATIEALCVKRGWRCGCGVLDRGYGWRAWIDADALSPSFQEAKADQPELAMLTIYLAAVGGLKRDFEYSGPPAAFRHLADRVKCLERLVEQMRIALTVRHEETKP